MLLFCYSAGLSKWYVNIYWTSSLISFCFTFCNGSNYVFVWMDPMKSSGHLWCGLIGIQINKLRNKLFMMGRKFKQTTFVSMTCNSSVCSAKLQRTSTDKEVESLKDKKMKREAVDTWWSVDLSSFNTSVQPFVILLLNYLQCRLTQWLTTLLKYVSISSEKGCEITNGRPILYL